MEQRSFTVTEAGSAVTHTLAYTLWNGPSGTATSPRTVVCVHGLTRNGRDFDRLAERLAATGAYRVACIDLIGRGRSEYLKAGSTSTYGYPLYVDHVLQFLKHLGWATVDVWVGTSLGGLVGLMLNAAAPGVIRHLVLNDIGAVVSRIGLLRLRTYVGKTVSFGTAKELETYMRGNMATFGALTEAQWAEIAQNSTVAETDPATGTTRYRLAYDPRVSVTVDEAAEVVDVDLSAFWTPVAVPTLLLRGAESDLLLRETADAMVAGKAAGLVTLAEFAGVGHAPALVSDDQLSVVQTWMDAQTY